MWLRALLFAALVAPATAAVVTRHDLPSLARAADAIVFARVAATRAERRGGRIYTVVALATEHVVKGEVGETFTVEVLGGTLDGLGQKVSGEAVFTEGERVALFLERHPTRPVLRPVGMSQGKLRVELSPGGLELLRQTAGLTLVEKLPDGSLAPAAPALPEAMPMVLFLRELAAAVP